MREEYIGEMRWRGQSAAHTRFDEDELFAETAEDDVLDTPPTDKLPRETLKLSAGRYTDHDQRHSDLPAHHHHTSAFAQRDHARIPVGH